MTTEEDSAKNESEIRDVIGRLANAIGAKDIRGVMSVYAPELVAFDVGPPLQQVGIERYERQWLEVFGFFQTPITYELRELSITAGDDVAFSHALGRITTMNDGHEAGIWVRWTACYRKTNGKWLIAHLQASVPADMRSGKAMLDLQPSP
jgi:uncharacterized protein (TIGR02246 family)